MRTYICTTADIKTKVKANTAVEAARIALSKYATESVGPIIEVKPARGYTRYFGTNLLEVAPTTSPS